MIVEIPVRQNHIHADILAQAETQYREGLVAVAYVWYDSLGKVTFVYGDRCDTEARELAEFLHRNGLRDAVAYK